MDRALRRHHQERIKNKVKNYNNYYGLMDANSPRKVGIYSKTRRICSCMLCSGHKKLYGNGWQKYCVSDLRKLTNPDY